MPSTRPNPKPNQLPMNQGRITVSQSSSRRSAPPGRSRAATQKAKGTVVALRKQGSTQYIQTTIPMPSDGRGGPLVNSRGEEFLLEYDPELGNHAPMGRVSESSAMEVRAGRGPIYLDMTHFSVEDVRKMKVVLPGVTTIMERAGVMTGDSIIKKIKWAPSFFGTIASGGGVVVNTGCESNLQGLYACGDAMVRLGSLPRALAGAKESRRGVL